jgi:hypothetical protein
MTHRLLALAVVLFASTALPQPAAAISKCKAAKQARKQAKAAVDACLANFVQQQCGGTPCLLPAEIYANACLSERQALEAANVKVVNKCGPQVPYLGPAPQ